MAEFSEIDRQRQYYERTSPKFDEWHLGHSGDAEHEVACDLIISYLHQRAPKASLLDIGGGTGRFYRYIRDNHPDSTFNLMAIEPSAAQRKIAYCNGVPEARHIEGDATQIQFADDHFDYCTEFGVVHHIKDNRKAVREMCRVARHGVFLSDSNRYGQGTKPARLVKNLARITRTYELANYFRTFGKRYHYSELDGVYYSFSVFDVVDVVREKFPNVYFWPTRPVSNANLLYGAPQVLLVAVK